jgi:hypothetical protein
MSNFGVSNLGVTIFAVFFGVSMSVMMFVLAVLFSPPENRLAPSAEEDS